MVTTVAFTVRLAPVRAAAKEPEAPVVRPGPAAGAGGARPAPARLQPQQPQQQAGNSRRASPLAAQATTSAERSPAAPAPAPTQTPAPAPAPTIIAEDAGQDSVVPEVAALPDAGDTTGVEGKPTDRKAGPLARGGTLKGEKAAGKDAGLAVKGQTEAAPQLVDGRFVDDRWVNGTWDLTKFASENGKTDWDKVIDAEVLRRKVLEMSPIASMNEDPVYFDTAQIPWWAWVRRFHLPEAEKLNGRASMVGFVWALLWERLSGQSLSSQLDSFGGKFFLIVALAGILLIRRNEDATQLRDLADEWTFYDKQWQASWKQGDTVKDE